jgi:hypothetical protein
VANLLSELALKQWLCKDIRQLEKLLLVLAVSEEPAKLPEIRARALRAGLKIGRGWNPSATLSRSKGFAIRVPSGWELTDLGKTYLREMGVSS